MPDDDRLLFVCGTQSTRQPQCRTVNVSGIQNPIPALLENRQESPHFEAMPTFLLLAVCTCTTFFRLGATATIFLLHVSVRLLFEGCYYWRVVFIYLENPPTSMTAR